MSRAEVSEKLWQLAEHHIIAEWICCEPLDPRHSLCAKGYEALGMAKTLLVDGDTEKVWNPDAPVLSAVMDLLAGAPSPVEGEETGAALARYLNDQRMSTILGAFRILGWPSLRFQLVEDDQRPRCADCHMPHDLTPEMAHVCASAGEQVDAPEKEET